MRAGARVRSRSTSGEMAEKSRVAPVASSRSGVEGSSVLTMSGSVVAPLRPTSTGADLGLSVSDDGSPGLFCNCFYDRDAIFLLADRRAHDDLLLGHPHAAELHAEALEPVGTATALGLRPRDLGHGVEAVQDLAGQADLLGELLVDVDRVEVARRARVADREVLVRHHRQLRDLHAHTPRTMLVHVPTQTSSPSWLTERDSKT